MGSQTREPALPGGSGMTAQGRRRVHCNLTWEWGFALQWNEKYHSGGGGEFLVWVQSEGLDGVWVGLRGQREG